MTKKIELIYMGTRYMRSVGKLADAFCLAGDKTHKPIMFERGKYRSVGSKFEGIQDGDKQQVTYNEIGEIDDQDLVDKWSKQHWAAQEERDQVLSRKRQQTAESLVDEHVIRGLKKAVEGLTMGEAENFIRYLMHEVVYDDAFSKLSIKIIQSNKKKAKKKTK